MSTMTTFTAFTATVTREQAEQVLAAIIAHYAATPDWLPCLMEEGWDDRQWTIVWDNGPPEWAYEFGDVATEQGLLPAGVWVESVNHLALSVNPRPVA